MLPAKIGRTTIARGKYRMTIQATIPTDLSDAVMIKGIAVK